jgi:transcriptional regulator with XRE-family HTH domain
MRKGDILPEHQIVLNEIGKRLQYLMKKKDVTILQLSKDLNVSRNKIGMMLAGKENFTILSLSQLLNYLGITIEKFFRMKI